MKKTIVLLAGYPATGKSYLCNKILEKLPDFLIVSQDDMKEKLFDQYGFLLRFSVHRYNPDIL